MFISLHLVASIYQPMSNTSISAYTMAELVHIPHWLHVTSHLDMFKHLNNLNNLLFSQTAPLHNLIYLLVRINKKINMISIFHGT